MTVVEYNGVEYALITQGGKLSWINTINQVASKDLSKILLSYAEEIGVYQPKVAEQKQKIIFDFEKKYNRPRTKPNGISIKVNIKSNGGKDGKD